MPLKAPDLPTNGGKKKGNGHKPQCMCPICKNMRKGKKGGDNEDKEVIQEVVADIPDGQEIVLNDDKIEMEGGKKKKKGNGHKPGCMCPICKNMRKAKKGGDNDVINEEINIMSDMEEGKLGKSDKDLSSNSLLEDVKIKDDTKDQTTSMIEMMEEGRAGNDINVGGSSRKSRRVRKSRKSKRTRKHRKSRRSRKSRK